MPQTVHSKNAPGFGSTPSKDFLAIVSDPGIEPVIAVALTDASVLCVWILGSNPQQHNTTSYNKDEEFLGSCGPVRS